MNTKNSKSKNIVMCKDKKDDDCFANKFSKKLITPKVSPYQPPKTLKILNITLSNLYNIILINIKFNRSLPIGSTNFKECIFQSINNKSCLYLNGFGTIELTQIDELKDKNFNCFVYSRLCTLSILLIDPSSPNFIATNTTNIKFINFKPNNTILNIPCYVTTTPVNLTDFKYITQPINVYSPWEFYEKKINETAIVVVTDNLNSKIFGNLEALTLFTRDLYIISTSLTPSLSSINLEFVNIKVSGSLFIILPDNYGITLTYSNLNIIKQL